MYIHEYNPNQELIKGSIVYKTPILDAIGSNKCKVSIRSIEEIIDDIRFKTVRERQHFDLGSYKCPTPKE